MNEHRLYIVLGILFLILGALFIRRSDGIGASAFVLAGTGIIINGARALRKGLQPAYNPRVMKLRQGLLLLAITLTIVVIFLQERG
ncbi:MAG: hypothetical protein MUF71_06110 [Candidatus Kapabacteria bacterium]|jgi:hypothetical protein|nr:hypothetical protein [Candidatus Kapabacteria bacterium]